MTFYAIARILKSSGTKGFVKIEPLTHSAERFERLREVYVGMPDRQGTFSEPGGNDDGARRMVIKEVRSAQNGLLVKFHTIDDRTASDTLVGNYLLVDESQLLRPPERTYFIHDIIGCAVWWNEKPAGTIVEVLLRSQGLAQDIWVVESTEGSPAKQYLVPATREYVKEVDVPQRKILVDRLEEFLQTEAQQS